MEMKPEITALTRERDALKTVLEWYATSTNYDYEGRPLANPDAPHYELPQLDRGHKARVVLADFGRGYLRKP